LHNQKENTMKTTKTSDPAELTEAQQSWAKLGVTIDANEAARRQNNLWNRADERQRLHV
jgi:hypothetical protein